MAENWCSALSQIKFETNFSQSHKNIGKSHYLSYSFANFDIRYFNKQALKFSRSLIQFQAWQESWDLRVL